MHLEFLRRFSKGFFTYNLVSLQKIYICKKKWKRDSIVDIQTIIGATLLPTNGIVVKKTESIEAS